MIRKFNERENTIKENLKGGNGLVNFKQIATGEDFYKKIKTYATLTFKPGDGIGYHTHINEQEIILINKGEALYNDDGNETTLHIGDVAVCYENHYHSITNASDSELEIIALIIEK